MRAAIVVAGVVLGAILIANAFPPSTGPAPAATPSASASSRPSPSISQTPPATSLTCPAATTVRVAVENATHVAGLAAATATRLKAAGYVFNTSTDVSDALSQSATSTVFYRGPANKTAGICLKRKFFPT